MKNVFNFMEPTYHLQSNNWLERLNVKSVTNGTESGSSLGLKIWIL